MGGDRHAVFPPPREWTGGRCVVSEQVRTPRPTPPVGRKESRQVEIPMKRGRVTERSSRQQGSWPPRARCPEACQDQKGGPGAVCGWPAGWVPLRSPPPRGPHAPSTLSWRSGWWKASVVRRPSMPDPPPSAGGRGQSRWPGQQGPDERCLVTAWQPRAKRRTLCHPIFWGCLRKAK